MKNFLFIVPGGAQAPPAIAPGVAVRATMETAMFKATSQNMVSRDRRAVTQNQRNMNGIDESVFFNAYEKELKRLGAEKKATEIEISKYNEMIKTASITAQARGQYVNTQVFIRLANPQGGCEKAIVRFGTRSH